MTYTVWLHGQQIGETNFEYSTKRDKRAGLFHPTDFGVAVLPAITGMLPALVDFAELCGREGIAVDPARPDHASAALRALGETPQGARVIAAAQQIAAIEVRDPSGIA